MMKNTNEIMDLVFEALTNNQSCEFEEDRVDYYLHLDDEGNIKTSELDNKDTMLVESMEYPFEGCTTDDVYEKENKSDEDFMNLVGRLTERYEKLLNEMES